jgi:antitoxin (DNA-binding transcriptional repressor) of toxin-antitoxin stability system
MRRVSIREMRALLPRLDETLAQEGEMVIVRRGKPIARLLPAAARPERPSNADLRARCPFQTIPSEVLIREDRDAR